MQINNGSTLRFDNTGGGFRYDVASKLFKFGSTGGGVLDVSAVNFVCFGQNTIQTTGGSQNKISGNSGFNLNGNSLTFDVTTGSNSQSDLLLTASLSNGGTMSKIGNGTLELASPNTYTGETTISAGNVLVSNASGSATGTGAVTIAAGATLKGNGSIAGAVTVNGNLRPGGVAPSALTISNSLTLASGSSTHLRLAKAGAVLTNDSLAGLSSVTAAGTLNVTFSGDQLANGDTFTLIKASSRSGTFSAINLPALASGFSWDTSALYSSGTISVVGPKLNQTITFSSLASVASNASPITLAATTSSGQPITYTSSNPAIATIAGNILTVKGPGTVTITASQSGNVGYSAATSVSQTLTVINYDRYLDTNSATTGSGITAGATITEGNSWSSDINGLSSTAAWVDNMNMIFSAGSDVTGAYNVNLIGNKTIKGFSTRAGSPTLSGGSFNLAQVIGFDIQTGVTQINSVISGSGSINKLGSGTLLLSAANTFSGSVAVNQGLVKLGTATALGAGNIAVTKVSVADGAAVDLNGQIDAGYGFQLAGLGQNGTGALINSGAAMSLYNVQVPNIKLSATSALGGTGDFAMIAPGYAPNTLDLSGFNLIKRGANTFYLCNTTATAGTVSIEEGVLSQYQASNLNNATVWLANNASSTLNLNNINLPIGSLSGNGVVNLGSAGLTVGGMNQDSTYNGSVLGTGTLNLNGVSRFTGGLNVNQGTIAVTASTGDDDSALGSKLNPITVAQGATLRLNGGRATGYHLGSVTLNGGSLVINSWDTNLAAGNTTFLNTAPININGGGQWRRRNAGNSVDVSAVSSGSIISVSELNLYDTSANFNIGDGVSANDLLISLYITGNGGLSKNGNGTLLLSNANTFSGSVVVNQGTLRLANPLALGASINGGFGRVNIGAGGTLDVNGQIDTLYGINLAGNGLDGNGALINSGAGISDSYAQTPNIRLTANASIGGTGDFAMIASNYAANTLDLAGFTLSKKGSNAFSLCNTISTAGSVVIEQGVLSQYNASNLSAASVSTFDAAGVSLNLNNYNLSVSALSGGGNAGGNLNLGSGALILGSLNQNTIYSGLISGTGTMTKVGTGTFSATNVLNSFSGNWNVNAGQLLVTSFNGNSATSAVGAKIGARALMINAPGSMSWTNNNIFGGSGMAEANLPAIVLNSSAFTTTRFNPIGNITLNGAQLINSNASDPGNYHGFQFLGTVIANGTVASDILTTNGAGNHLTGGSGTNFQVTDPGGVLRIGTTLHNCSADYTGLGSVRKTGLGVLELNAINDYTGVTTVTAGELRVNGFTAASSAVSVASGARLSGNGTAAGAVTIFSGASVSPGVNAVGHLKTGALALSGAYNCEINGIVNDKLEVTGNLSLNAGSAVVITATAPVATSYVIATYTGTLTGTPSVTGVPVGYVVDTTVANQLRIVRTATDFDIWSGAYTFPAGADKTATGDPDDDGCDNRTEYAFGQNPVLANSASLIWGMNNKTGTFSYSRRKVALTGLIYKIWFFTNMVTWTQDSTATQVATASGDNESVVVTLSGAKPMTMDRIFVKVSAE